MGCPLSWSSLIPFPNSLISRIRDSNLLAKNSQERILRSSRVVKSLYRLFKIGGLSIGTMSNWQSKHQSRVWIALSWIVPK